MTEKADFAQFRQTFLGNCMGVALGQRGPSDLHVCFTILHEDDGNWFASENSVSTYWLSELIAQLTVARQWCDGNCDIDEGYGWKFKS